MGGQMGQPPMQGMNPWGMMPMPGMMQPPMMMNGPNPWMMGMQKSSKKKKKDKDGSSSSDSSDSSSSPSPARNGAWGMGLPGWPMAAMPMPTPENLEAEIEEYFERNPVDSWVIDRLRELPPDQQLLIIRRGPLNDSRNPSNILMNRIREFEVGKESSGSGWGQPGSAQEPYRPPRQDRDGGPLMARRPAKKTIEQMVSTFKLKPEVAWALRALAPNKQKLAAMIDPTGQDNPNEYVMDQLKDPKFGQTQLPIDSIIPSTRVFQTNSYATFF